MSDRHFGRLLIQFLGRSHAEAQRRREEGEAAMSEQDKIKQFLAGQRFAVVGASADREKYGNKVLRVYQQNHLEVVPINPKADEIEGLKAYPDLASVPGSIDGVSIITPPAVTVKIVDDAVKRGIKNIWMQPGAESKQAVEAAESVGANVIAGGPCILVSLRYHED
jgi:predicted CoA-binding protein